MGKKDKNMWEILVPTQMIRDGELKPCRTRYHRVWDAKVREITGGLTVLSPARGEWLSPANELFCERMIPVRIYCTQPQIEEIIQFTIKYYNQEAVLAYQVSDNVLLRYRDE